MRKAAFPKLVITRSLLPRSMNNFYPCHHNSEMKASGTFKTISTANCSYVARAFLPAVILLHK